MRIELLLPDSAAFVAPPRHHLEFSHAFQPIVDTIARTVFAHEALIRGMAGESAEKVLKGLSYETLHEIDRQSVTRAVATAGRLNMQSSLSINSLPHSLESSSRCNELQAASEASGFPLSRVIVEVTENEAIADISGFTDTIAEYRRLGVQIAIDDFGAGHSGLNLLADFQPDLLKLDMNLVRSIHNRGPRQAIVRAILQVCEDLAIEVIAEGVESPAEHDWFSEHGVRLFQGYLFAKPAFEAMPPVSFP